MLRRLTLPALAVLACAAATHSRSRPLAYPPTDTVDVVDDYHGTLVTDPYRWLEDLDSPATRSWVRAQGELTSSILENLPGREPIRQRLLELWDYPRYRTPFRKGGRVFFRRNGGLQDQDVLYVQDTADGEARILLDPNRLSEDGTVALGGFWVSHDGDLAVYGRITSGSDWRVFRVRDVKTGEDLDDELRWIKFSSAAWTPDGKGFFYSRYAAPREKETYEQVNKNQKLYYHRLGTSQDEDELIYERPDDPELGFDPQVTDDGRYLVIEVWKGTDRRNRIHVLDLQDSAARIVRLLDGFDASYAFVGNRDRVFYFRTDRDAPRGRLVAVDLDSPDPARWRELIPESEAVLQDVLLAGNRFVAHALVDVRSRLTVHDLDGAPVREIALPTIGSVGLVTGQPDDREIFFSFTSFTVPSTVYRHDVDTGETAVVHPPGITIDPSRYVVRQVFYESRDGTRIPMFLVHGRGIERDGSNPAYLTGYGGFQVSLRPGFSVARLVWLEMGGVFAMPNLRGGGEYGEEWHRDGMLENKQNVFDDFLAAAEYLVAEGYTVPARLAIAGRSNGGLLTAACLTQRPDLFGAVIVGNGVLDMLRFHRFTIGWAWTPDYGSADDPEQFPYLFAYSPLHNVRPGVRYPTTLITTADHDDRVVPGHSFKFAATLQAAQAADAPILLRVETKAGHGAGTPTGKVIDLVADEYAFLAEALAIEGSFPGGELGSR